MITFFATLGFTFTFIGLVLGVMKVQSFFTEDFPEVKRRLDELTQTVHLLKQRIEELEEK